MTAPNKDLARILSRAESLRLAITASPLPREWERIDLDHMADAAAMLWDQANDCALRDPDAKAELAEAISRIFEPLLTWVGRFDLCAQLARARGKSRAFRAPRWDAHLSLFEALAFQGKFQDDFPWQRETTFSSAQAAYAELWAAHPLWDAREVGRAAHAWHLIGLGNLAREILNTSPDVALTRQGYLDLDAPRAWREAHISTSWLRVLSDLQPPPSATD